MTEKPLVYLVSYKINGNKWNPLMKESKKRFMEKGFDIKLVEGYNLKENPNMKKNTVVYLNFLDKVIPKAIKTKAAEGFFVAEDDAYLSDKVDYAFIISRLKKVKDYKNTIIRVGYQKRTSNTYVVGTQLTWIPMSQLTNLKTIMESRIPQHFDGFLSKLNHPTVSVKLLDEEIQLKKKQKYVHEIEHDSLILGGTRKGIKITN